MSLQKPSVYSENLNKLYLMFNTSLDEVRNSFVQHKLGLSSNYENDLTTLNDIRADIFTTQQELFASTETVRNKVEQLNDLITQLNYSNDKVTREIRGFDNSGLAAQGELKMQGTIFEELFTQNIVLFFTILILFIHIIKK